MAVVAITPETIADEVLDVEGTSLVLFHMSRCPYCKAFRPLFESRDGAIPYRLGQAVIDEDEHPFWTRFGIEVVPTVIAFRGGEVIGRRDAQAHVGLTEADLLTLLDEVG